MVGKIGVWVDMECPFYSIGSEVLQKFKLIEYLNENCLAVRGSGNPSLTVNIFAFGVETEGSIPRPTESDTVVNGLLLLRELDVKSCVA